MQGLKNVTMLVFVWLMGKPIMKEEWNTAIMVLGLQFVNLIQLQLFSCAKHWDIHSINVNQLI